MLPKLIVPILELASPWEPKEPIGEFLLVLVSIKSNLRPIFFLPLVFGYFCPPLACCDKLKFLLLTYVRFDVLHYLLLTSLSIEAEASSCLLGLTFFLLISKTFRTFLFCQHILSKLHGFHFQRRKNCLLFLSAFIWVCIDLVLYLFKCTSFVFFINCVSILAYGYT